ncbi:SDR family oxidoreductase [Pedobacter aquae]|uniref:SDR family oxidoreductase n=1 Tax=Pedobacter aquae TaxID=2605747 RepID=A0A5C0VM03_9SPHI|nr:SDR family oxidoreductase [Pedobacter aquae]QEK52014.1 SDR family oxidoreductase [Pedobacter aquae]
MNILITGATKGIGKAIAIKMAQEGHYLALCARNETELTSLKEEIQKLYPSVKVYTQAVNCSLKAEVNAFAAQSLQYFGFIDVLINNVGVFEPAAILDEADDLLEKHFMVNVNCAYLLYKKIGLSMREARKGHIFNICSVASIQNIVNAGSYCVTKAAMLSLNNIMRAELINNQVKVTAVLPGSTLTSSWEGTTVAADKFIQPEDVALMINQTLNLSAGANVDQLIISPTGGQV